MFWEAVIWDEALPVCFEACGKFCFYSLPLFLSLSLSHFSLWRESVAKENCENACVKLE